MTYDLLAGTELRLKGLYDAGMLRGGRRYSLSIAAHALSCRSVPSKAVMCEYLVDLTGP